VPSLEALVRDYIKRTCNKPGNVYLGIPHRLDRPVSGVVLFARNTKAARRLAEQFRDHRVGKVYWAAVSGVVEPAEGEWIDWLRKLPEEARTECVAEGEPGAKEARLSYRVLQPLNDGATLLELRPKTGRMHQIRVQAARRGHPVLGDELYGSAVPFGPPVELPRDRIIALHARALTFEHPTKHEPVTVQAPLPAAWHPLLSATGPSA
jgi:23S rRNA pseudouridine1911/1915/1917 synthase